jgi:hypothetical protein
MEDGLDALVIGDYVLLKQEQPRWTPRRRPVPATPRVADADDRRRLQRWARVWLPAAPRQSETTSPWLTSEPHSSAACVALEEPGADPVPARLLSRVPAGRLRTAVRQLLADAINGRM